MPFIYSPWALGQEGLTAERKHERKKKKKKKEKRRKKKFFFFKLGEGSGTGKGHRGGEDQPRHIAKACVRRRVG